MDFSENITGLLAKQHLEIFDIGRNLQFFLEDIAFLSDIVSVRHAVLSCPPSFSWILPCNTHIPPSNWQFKSSICRSFYFVISYWTLMQSYQLKHHVLLECLSPLLVSPISVLTCLSFCRVLWMLKCVQSD